MLLEAETSMPVQGLVGIHMEMLKPVLDPKEMLVVAAAV
jgi:hypothetical protein